MSNRKIEGTTEKVMREQIMKYRHVLRMDDTNLSTWIRHDFGNWHNCPICLNAPGCHNCPATEFGVKCMNQEWFVGLDKISESVNLDLDLARSLVRDRTKYWVNLYNKTYKSKI